MTAKMTAMRWCSLLARSAAGHDGEGARMALSDYIQETSTFLKPNMVGYRENTDATGFLNDWLWSPECCAGFAVGARAWAIRHHEGESKILDAVRAATDDLILVFEQRILGFRQHVLAPHRRVNGDQSH